MSPIRLAMFGTQKGKTDNFDSCPAVASDVPWPESARRKLIKNRLTTIGCILGDLHEDMKVYKDDVMTHV